jgi:hypothetical protein
MAKIDMVAAPAPQRPQQPTAPAIRPAPPTADEIKERNKNLFASQGWGPPPEEPTPAVAPEPVVVPPVAAPAAAAPAPVRPPAPRPMRELAMAEPEPVEPTALKPDLEMAEEDAESFDCALYLAREFPEFSKLPEQELAWIKLAYAYQDKWVADHPGEQFDIQSADHKAFFDANPRPVTDELILRSKIRKEARALHEKETAPLKKEAEAAKKERLIRQFWPAISSNQDRAVVLLVEASRPELASLIRSGTAESWAPDLSEAALARLDEADPIARSIYETYGGMLRNIVQELELTLIPDLGYKLDLELPLHKVIDGYRRRAEEALAQAPAEARVFDDGRQFISTDAKKARLAEIKKLPVAEQGHALTIFTGSYRTLTAEELEEYIANELGADAKIEIDRTDAISRRKYGGNQAPPTPPPITVVPPPAPAPAPAHAANPGYRPPPAAMSSSAETVTQPKPPGEGAKTKGASAADFHFK